VPTKARFCGPVLLDGIFKNRLMEKVKAAADPSKIEAVTPAEIESLYLLLWEHGIKQHFDGSSSIGQNQFLAI
jgi:hypothetical protein